ncbi:DUF4199 family protein [bacterium]|nr:DUF4199 family protein [bacterium]
MDKQEKEFILNRGLILGLVLMMFPVIDLVYGMNMSSKNYFIIFGFIWIILFTFLLLKWSKEFASYYDVFPFRDSFRTLFIISFLAFSVLTLGKTFLWTVSFPEKYIEINEQRELHYFQFPQSLIDDAYQNGSFSEEQYEEQLESLTYQQDLLEKKWEAIKADGLGTTYFLQMLVSVLFIISIYCAILALFVRKKEKFIKTN